MSYVGVPRRAGYAGYNDLPGADLVKLPSAQDYKNQASAAASSIADQSKAQAINFAEQQLQNYPSAAQVLGEYSQYAGYLRSIPGFNPADLQDPAKVVGLMKQALIAYAKDNGIPTNTAEFEAYVTSVAASQFGVSLPTSWPMNVKDLKSVAVDLACTAVVMYTGVDPKILTVTVDALMDGEITEHEAEAIGACAGAIAGAVIGQAFGIPAPIGAFVGGLAGQYVGGTIGQIFGATNHPTQQEMMDEARKWANATLDRANAACSEARSLYWRTFDQMIQAIELQWETSEVKLGWRFGIRWFGIETYSQRGQAFSHAWDPTKSAFTGDYTSAWRASQVGSGTPMETHYSDAGVDKVQRSMVYTYGCSFNFGCPYPVVPGIPMPPGNAARVGQAFLARGALWIPVEQRHYQCRYPPSQNDFDTLAWTDSMQRDLNGEIAAVKALRILSVTVVGDLIKTSAVVAAEKSMNDLLKTSAVQLNANALNRASDLRHAQATGKQLSDLLNYGTLALGAGLLGAVFWKRRSA